MNRKNMEYRRPQCEVILVNMGRDVALNIDKSENTGNALVRGEQDWDSEEETYEDDFWSE